MIKNQELAELLRRVSVVFEVVDGDFFRARAYQNAANAIEILDIPVSELWEKDRLDDIPWIGPNLKSHLDELFKTGRVKHFEQELKRVPTGLFPLLTVRGIGPKIAYRLATHFKLNDPENSLIQLKKLLDQNKLQELEGFGPVLEQKIRTALESNTGDSHRMLLSEALQIADQYLDYIKTNKSILEAESLGSLRRRSDTVGDIDLAISTDSPEEATKHVLSYPGIATVISSGPSVSRVHLKSDHEVDIKLSPSAEWGSLLQHYTGSKLHNIALRNLALSQNLSLSEHGIKDKTDHSHKFKDEHSFYGYLKMPFIEPELREGQDEIQKALEKKLPNLVTIKDIKGDLHIHSDYSFPTSHDIGVSSLKEILVTASKLNYEYVGLSDHNPKFSGLTTNERKRILQDRKNYLITQYREYEKTVKTRVIKLLIGLEIDIRSNGDLSLEPELIDLLDYAIVSVHSNFDLSATENTKRILKALGTHPKILILGHPTGRLLNRRSGIEADWEAIFDFAAKNNKYLEINASPPRLDLPDDLAREALRHHTKLVIDSDTHNVRQLSDMRFGVWVARRAWATAPVILNTLSFSQLQTVLNLKL